MEVNTEEVYENNYACVCSSRISWTRLVPSAPPGLVKSPHNFIKDGTLFSI